MSTTRKQLIGSVQDIMSSRSERLSILRDSSIIGTQEIDAGELAEKAIDILKHNPRHITKWITEEELALFTSLEDM